MPDVPRLGLGSAVDSVVEFLRDNFSPLFSFIRWLLEGPASGIENWLGFPHPIIFALIAGVIAWRVRSWQFGLFVVPAFLLIASVNMWDHAMRTLSAIAVATFFAVVLAIPVGILAARNAHVSALVRPVLDFMQTLPALVYLMFVVAFFRIGIVPGIVATMIFAIPPGVRLTELGIRQVDAEVVEAAHAFGATGRQILLRVQLPLALPSIMAGINQVIMLALSMVVLAGMVGAGGLGGEVIRAIQRLNYGLGFEAGVSVVILAIFLDRITEAIGRRVDPRKTSGAT